MNVDFYSFPDGHKNTRVSTNDLHITFCGKFKRLGKTFLMAKKP